MPSSVLCKQCPEKNIFTDGSSILRRLSIGKLTEFMPQHLEKLMTRQQGPREIDHHPAAVMVWWRVAYNTPPSSSAKVDENTLLEPVVKSLNNTFFSNEHCKFKQDLTSARKANSSMDWFWGIFWISLLQVIGPSAALTSTQWTPKVGSA